METRIKAEWRVSKDETNGPFLRRSPQSAAQRSKVLGVGPAPCGSTATGACHVSVSRHVCSVAPLSPRGGNDKSEEAQGLLPVPLTPHDPNVNTKQTNHRNHRTGRGHTISAHGMAHDPSSHDWTCSGLFSASYPSRMLVSTVRPSGSSRVLGGAPSPLSSSSPPSSRRKTTR